LEKQSHLRGLEIKHFCVVGKQDLAGVRFGQYQIVFIIAISIHIGGTVVHCVQVAPAVIEPRDLIFPVAGKIQVTGLIIVPASEMLLDFLAYQPIFYDPAGSFI